MIDKVQKIREKVERLMYDFNLQADIASCEDAETEKVADIKYQLCKKILEYIDSMQGKQVDYGKLQTSLDNALSKETKESWENFLQEEEKMSVWHDASEEPKSDKDIAVVNREGCMWSRYILEDLCIEWEHFVNDVEIDKWAYSEDLLKL